MVGGVLETYLELNKEFGVMLWTARTGDREKAGVFSNYSTCKYMEEMAWCGSGS